MALSVGAISANYKRRHFSKAAYGAISAIFGTMAPFWRHFSANGAIGAKIAPNKYNTL